MKYENLSLSIIFKIIMNPLIKAVDNQDVFFVLLTISFLLLAILKSNYWKHTKLLLLGVFAQRYANQFLREDNAFTQRVNFLTFSLMVINFSLIIAKILNITVLSKVLGILFCILIFYFLKVLIIKFLGLVFMLKDISKLYIFFSFLFDRSLAILIFPLAITIYFFSIDVSQILILITYILVILILILKLVWLWKIGSKAFGLSYFYIFLYLCALEISPLLLLAQGVFY